MPESIVAFSQDLEASEPPIFAEVGLIVLPEITRRAMEAAVGFLAPRGFFERFRPLEENERIW